MKHLIVGTAGHVDHGKTALIKKMSGIDTDRLKEEKERGISIDIGFAALRLDEEFHLGIIDVPGHERFLKNMLAGTGGIDMVLLVIAADEGIMPQTREHFEMIRLLGIQHGIVALNKVDKVEPDWIEMVEEEIKDYLKSTFLESAPLCRVSAMTGEGLDMLRETLRKEAAKVITRDPAAPFRMWIDRSFNLKGQGLVVTGSILSGQIQVGAAVTLYPDDRALKIRGIESHHQDTESVAAGQRASLRLSGAVLEEVERGMLLAEKGFSKVAKIWDGAIHWHTQYPSGTRIRLHLGTGESIGRISYPKEEMSEAMPTVVRIHLERPLAATMGDQAILRRFSPQDLIGGITLLAPGENVGRRVRQMAKLAVHYQLKNYEELMAALLVLFDKPPTIDEWIQSAGYLNPYYPRQAIEQLLKKGRAKKAGNYYLAEETLGEWQQKMNKILSEYHRTNPKEPGISRETLRRKIRLDSIVADWYWQEAQRNKQIVVIGEFIASPVHAASHGGSVEELKFLLSTKADPRQLIDMTQEWLIENLQRPAQEIKPFFEQLLREGEIIRLPGVHVYRKTIQYIGTIIQRHFESHETLSVAELRDLLNTSRRLTLPLLEYYDSHKYTHREGDVRRPGPSLKNFSE